MKHSKVPLKILPKYRVKRKTETSNTAPTTQLVCYICSLRTRQRKSWDEQQYAAAHNGAKRPPTAAAAASRGSSGKGSYFCHHCFWLVDCPQINAFCDSCYPFHLKLFTDPTFRLVKQSDGSSVVLTDDDDVEVEVCDGSDDELVEEEEVEEAQEEE